MPFFHAISFFVSLALFTGILLVYASFNVINTTINKMQMQMWQLEVLSMAALVLTMLQRVPKDAVGLGKRFAHFHHQTEEEKDLVKQSKTSV